MAPVIEKEKRRPAAKDGSAKCFNFLLHCVFVDRDHLRSADPSKLVLMSSGKTDSDHA